MKCHSCKEVQQVLCTNGYCEKCEEDCWVHTTEEVWQEKEVEVD